MFGTKKTEDISKMTLVQLKEVLQREDILLKNQSLINKLPDNGKSIREFRDKVENEIKYREELQQTQECINKLSLETDKHTERLCQIEKIPDKDRYKPFSTLNKVMDVQPDSKVFKIMENCAHYNTPTKLIPLPESIHILKEQDERVKAEQIRARHNRIFEKLKEYEEEADTEDEPEIYIDPDEIEKG